MDGHHGLSRRALFGLGAAATVAAALPGCGRDDPLPTTVRTTTGAPDVVTTATEAYIFGYPMIMLDIMRAVSAPTNVLDHSTLPDPLDRGVARLSHDMVYTQAWLDLAREPMVLQIPGTEPDRYWVFQLLDGWGNTVHDLTSKDPRTTVDADGPPYTYLIAGPHWSGRAPAHTVELRIPTALSTIVGRVQINGPEDAPRVDEWQRKMKLVPLSLWEQGEFDATVTRVHQIDRGTEPPVKRIAALDGRTYLNRMCRLMLTNPPAPDDEPLMRRLATIGVRPGGTVDGLPDSALDDAVHAAHHQIETWQDPTARMVNGWDIPTQLSDFGTDYLRRAALTMRSPGFAPTRDVLYATIWTAPTTDAAGDPLRYRIRFAPDQWPPTEAFASITAYDTQGFLVPNPAAIYSVGHVPAVVPARDGSVEIVLQNADPRPEVPAGNWLPIPATGEFSLTLRLYAPKQSALEGQWAPPPMERDE
ncbi:DUF1254 domain-containing protein [Nocardia sp. AG03]|uniref:DUF1254 domain-containing protein n=1 Tax=Nocardia sp. AG03 TaxID=3025312 RepID=UPI0024183A41|nr:DUF1254 domain-containing protein [Nocardia sp. AG03]